MLDEGPDRESTQLKFQRTLIHVLIVQVVVLVLLGFLQILYFLDRNDGAKCFHIHHFHSAGNTVKNSRIIEMPFFKFFWTISAAEQSCTL